MDLTFEKSFVDHYKNKLNKKKLYLIETEKNHKKLKDFMESLKQIFQWVDFEVKKGNEQKIEFNNFSFYGFPYGRLANYLIKTVCLPEKKVFSDKFTQRFFVSSMCPNCPKAFDLLIEFLKNKNIETKFYFCDDNQDFADNFGVMSVPCLIIEKNGNEIQRLVGSLNLEDLNALFEEKDKNELTSEYFINIIEQGKAADIADIMISENKVFQGFVSLFQSSKLGIRVGAAVTAEILAEKSQFLFEDLVTRLNEIYFEASIETKGDILYLFSLSEQKNKWIKQIEKISKIESNEILKEIIEDSLETLNSDLN
jgi:thiol-disulfide isomerase/thioredoxin